MARAMVGLLAAGLSLGLLAGCGGEEGAEETGPDRPGGFIGISVLTMTKPFFKEIADAVTDEARKNKHLHLLFGRLNRAGKSKEQSHTNQGLYQPITLHGKLVFQSGNWGVAPLCEQTNAAT